MNTQFTIEKIYEGVDLKFEDNRIKLFLDKIENNTNSNYYINYLNCYEFNNIFLIIDSLEEVKEFLNFNKNYIHTSVWVYDILNEKELIISDLI